jgi:hypothetical protein
MATAIFAGATGKRAVKRVALLDYRQHKPTTIEGDLHSGAVWMSGIEITEVCLAVWYPFGADRGSTGHRSIVAGGRNVPSGESRDGDEAI